MEDVPKHFENDNELTLGSRAAILVTPVAEVFSTPLALAISNEVLSVFIFSRSQIKNNLLAIWPACHVTITLIRKFRFPSNTFLDFSATTAYITQNSLEEFNGFQDRR